MLRLLFKPRPTLPLLSHRRSAAAFAPRFPIGSSGTSTTSFRTGSLGRRLQDSSRQASSEYAALKGTLGAGRRRACSTRSGCRKSWASSRTACGTTRRCSTTRISATTRSTRKRQQVQILFARLEAGGVVVQPRAAAIPLDDRARLDGRARRRSRVYRFAIENLYRQQEHVLDEAGEKLMSLASRLASAPERRLLGALDRRREVPEDHAVDRRRGHGLVRAVPRAARDAARAGRSRRRRSSRCTRPTRPR